MSDFPYVFDYSKVPIDMKTEGIMLFFYEDENGGTKTHTVLLRDGMRAKYVNNDYSEYISIANNYKTHNMTFLRNSETLLRRKRILMIEYVLVTSVIPDNTVGETRLIFRFLSSGPEQELLMNYLVDGGENNTYEVLSFQFTPPTIFPTPVEEE